VTFASAIGSSTSASLVKTGSGALTLSGPNTFTGSLTLSAGTLTLSGANIHTGGTTISAGTVILGNAAALGASAGAVSVASGAVLNLNGYTVANTNPLTLNGSGIGGTGALINSSSSSDGVYAGVVTLGSNSTIGNMNSARVMRITDGANSTINTGGFILTFKGAGQINIPRGTGISGSGSVVVDGIYLDLRTGGNQSVNNYTGPTTVINGGQIMYFSNNIGTGNINLNGGTLLGYAGADLTTRGFGTGSNQIQITGGESGFGGGSGTTINFTGVTEVQWGNASFNPSKFIVSECTFEDGIDLNGANRTIIATVAGVLSGGIRNTSGTPAGLIKEGGGTLTLSAVNSYNGPTTISAGTLKAGIANTLPNGAGKGNVVINGGATAGILDLANFDIAINGLDGTTGATLGQVINSTAGTKTLTLGSGNASGSFAGLIKTGTGNINLTKTGTGTQTLSGANTFTGATTINNGTLVVNGSLAAGSAVTVNNGGKLGGTGTIGGSATFNTGSTFASENGFLIINGLLTLNAGVTLSVGSVSGNSVILIASYGTLSGTFDTVSLPQGWKVDYDYEENSQIALVPPQPSVFRFR
jgi:autotransporter-associated beta strand protein